MYAINCKHFDRKTWPGENVNSRRIEHAVMDCPQWRSSCFMSSFVKFSSEEKLKISINKRPGQSSWFFDRPEKQNLVEDIKFLLPAKFHQILSNGFREEVKNMKSELWTNNTWSQYYTWAFGADALTSFNQSTKSYRKQSIWSSWCFRANQSTKMVTLALNWMRHFILFCNLWIEFDMTRSKYAMSSTRFLFFEPICQQRWLTWPPIAGNNFPLNNIWRNLTGSKLLTSSTKLVFFRLINQRRWPPWSLIGRDIFQLLLCDCGTELDETWQEASTWFLLSSFMFLRAQQCWPRHFRLLFYNCWIELYKTWQKAKTKFVFFSPICQQRWLP